MRKLLIFIVLLIIITGCDYLKFGEEKEVADIVGSDGTHRAMPTS